MQDPSLPAPASAAGAAVGLGSVSIAGSSTAAGQVTASKTGATDQIGIGGPDSTAGEGVGELLHDAAAIVPYITPLLPQSVQAGLQLAMALEELREPATQAYDQAGAWLGKRLAEVPPWVDTFLRAHTPPWFVDGVFPIIVGVGGALLETIPGVLWDLFRDFIFPAWGVFTQDLPALWKGVKRAGAGLYEMSPIEVGLGINDVATAVLAGIARFEWSLGLWLTIVSAVVGGGTGTAAGGAGSAAVTAGAAAPVGGAAGGGIGAAAGEALTWVLGEGTGGVLAAASLLVDLERLLLGIPAYLLEDDPTLRDERRDDLLATAFRAGTVVVLLVMAFLAVYVGRPVGQFVRTALKRPEIKKAAAKLEALAGSAPDAVKKAAGEIDWPLSTPAIELEHHVAKPGSAVREAVGSPEKQGVEKVLELVRTHLKIDGDMDYLGSRVSVADNGSFDQYMAQLFRKEHPDLSVEEALELAKSVPALYSAEAKRILVRTGLDPSKVTGILVHETSHFLFRPWLRHTENLGLNEAFAQTIMKRLVPDGPDAYLETMAELAPIVEKVGFENLLRTTVQGKKSDFVRLVDDALGEGAGVDLLARLEKTLQTESPAYGGGSFLLMGGKLPRYDGHKPTYLINPAHVPGRGLRPGKTPLPADAESVFQKAVPNDPVKPTAWFGKNSDGQIYRFSLGNDGTAHFSGIDGVGDGLRNLSPYPVERLNGK
ncbi:MAG TPA: hypothetical protein PLA94_14130 [Myxococcota bacterium]|nr:hypothetical protein [Myxococcota bacterium]